jgi:predicted phage terminase large subunit-like protein
MTPLMQEIQKLSTTSFWELYEGTQDPNEKKRLIIARCATDQELFCLLFFPHYCTREFNPFHMDFFEDTIFGERAIRRARAAPRGSAKSTLATLVKPIHDVCYGLERFILLISNTADLAAQKLKDIRAEVLSNTALASIYGLRFPKKNPGETQFILISDAGQTMFMAFGRGAQIRGVRFGEHRPSKVVCDDVEHSDEVYNERIRNKTLDWFREDVGKVGDTHTNIEFVGTVLHRQSLLATLISNPAYDSRLYKSVISWSERPDLWDEWTKLYTNIDDPDRLERSDAFYKANEAEMLKGTKVLWPEKEDYLYLMKEMIEIGRRSFFKEKQNEPLGAEDKVFEKIQWYREINHPQWGRGIEIESNGTFIPWRDLIHNTYGVLDPSTGQTKAKKGKLGDFSSLVTGFYHHTGRLFVHEDWTRREPPTKQIAEIFNHHEKWTYQKFGVETNLYRNLLLPNIIQERKVREESLKKKLHLPFYDIEQTENKEARIYRIEPKVTHGWILLNRALSEQFKTQLEEFPHADHDDCPDALEMLWGLVHNRYKPAGVSVDPMGG